VGRGGVFSAFQRDIVTVLDGCKGKEMAERQQEKRVNLGGGDAIFVTCMVFILSRGDLKRTRQKTPPTLAVKVLLATGQTTEKHDKRDKKRQASSVRGQN